MVIGGPQRKCERGDSASLLSIKGLVFENQSAKPRPQGKSNSKRLPASRFFGSGRFFLVIPQVAENKTPQSQDAPKEFLL